MTVPIQGSAENEIALSEREQVQEHIQTRDEEHSDLQQEGKSATATLKGKSAHWSGWFQAFKQVWPIYLSTHIAFLVLTYLASLFSIGNFSPKTLGLRSLLEAWDKWDTGHFTFIATQGYDQPFRTAFFPLYPLLEGGLAFVTRNPLIAGLIISNIATIFTFMVLYRIVAEDFEPQAALRAVLYMAIFPTAFFLSAAYNESLFICLTLLSIYYMRRGQWWAAGGLGFLAALTRSSGLFLVIPFVYEYLRQHNFQLKTLRLNSMSILCIPAGIGVFMVYCYFKFQDALSFSHAQIAWGRVLAYPWTTFDDAYHIIKYSRPLGFDSIHTVIDLSAWIFTFGLLLLCFVGPWRLPKDRWAYPLYGLALSIFFILFPSIKFPVQSLSRLVIELFPAFIMLALLGKKSSVQLYYLTISGSVLCFLLLQFLTGAWIV